jgi:hypothetical protein
LPNNARLPARHDLRKLEQLGHRLSLGDALGTERDIKRPAEVGDCCLDEGRRSRIDGRTKDQQLTIA